MEPPIEPTDPQDAAAAQSQPAGALRDPVLVVALGATGNQTALAAASLLLESTGQARPDAPPPAVLAEFEADDYYDYTVARPLVQLVDGQRVIDWPRSGVHHLPTADRDLLFLTGVEPHYRWQRFARSVADFALAAGVREVVLLSAFGGGTPHTRPLPLRWLPLQDTSDPVDARFGVPGEVPQYQGPGTLSMVLGVVLREAGLRVGALNATVPFYIGVDPSPHAVRALASAVAAEFGLPLDTAEVDERVAAVDRQAAEQMEASQPLVTFVRNLEQQYDDARPLLTAGPEAPPAPLDAEDVLADVDALLRLGRTGDGGPDRSRRA